MAPLDVAVPSPDATVTTPPVFTVLRPAPSTSPPIPLAPLPTVSDEPPATVRRCAVPSSSAPELPAFADPDEKMSIPLPPFAPEFADHRDGAVAVPSPDATVTTPPVFTVLRPKSTSTSPPLPLAPLPTVSAMSPRDRPSLFRCRREDGPNSPLEVPEEKTSIPELLGCPS